MYITTLQEERLYFYIVYRLFFEFVFINSVSS